MSDLPIEIDGIAEQLEEQNGFWRSCSGCHNLNEGVPTGPYSSIMKCHLGFGCRECGGIGAIWDNVDYSGFGEEEHAASSTELLEVLKPFGSGGDWGKIKAWIVNGAPSKEEGITAAKKLTALNVAADNAIAKAEGGEA